MSTKADIKRQRSAIDRQRLHLEREAVVLERQRLGLEQERRRVVSLLRIVCERFGDNDWAEGDDLEEILRAHLAQPLNARISELLARLAELQQSARDVDRREPAVVVEASSEPTARPAPAPERAIARRQDAPATRHSVITIRDQDRHRGLVGYRSTCVCTWRSPIEERRAAADRAGDEHTGRIVNHNPGVRRYA